MSKLTRRSLLGALAVASIAKPAIIHAQSNSKPVTIGFLSDTSSVYSENGGPLSKLGAEFAVADFGGSVLGRPVEVIQADMQNKPEVASALGREWVGDRGVTVLADGASSASALAVQQVARETKRVYLMTGPIANDLIGKQCSPYGFQFSSNSYAFTKSVTEVLTKQAGADASWFTIVIDNASGYALESDMQGFAKAAGGKSVGGVRTPITAKDYSAFLVQAKASGAKIIGLGLAGVTLRDCIKQVAEFGLVKGGQRLATPLLFETDVRAIGVEACQGFTTNLPWYWAMNEPSRVYAKRFFDKVGKPPSYQHALAYASVNHWLKAATAANSVDADIVAAKMKEMPVSDFFNKDIKIYDNGCVPLPMYLFEVMKPSEVKDKFDVFKQVGVASSQDANPAPGLFGCPLVKS
jgi:branched-chain amino acid transport system substrate-binding protein